MSDWIRFYDQRPPEFRYVNGENVLYRWRVSKRNILGMEMQPEWSGPLRLVGMGISENEWWPPFSSWDGYNRLVDSTLEWRLATPEESEKNITWNGLDLLPCPFTGLQPIIEYSGRYIGAPPYLPESLNIKSWLVSRSYRSAPELQRAWNKRI